MPVPRWMRVLLGSYGVVIMLLLYLPLVAVFFASISKARYLSFPIRRYSGAWYGEALGSATVRDLLLTSLLVAAIVTVVSVVLGYFAALAFARYRWRHRRLFQKLVLLPIFCVFRRIVTNDSDAT